MIVKSLRWNFLEAAARQWWFLPLILLPQLIPPYASQGYKLSEWGMVNAYILTHPIKGPFASLYPIFQIAPLVLLAISLAAKKPIRIFSAYVALSYIAVAFLQSISISNKYGFAVCTANVITFLILAGLWFREAVFPKVKFEPQKIPVRKYWAVLLALLPFWGPVNPRTLTPDFNPVYILTSGSGLSFCLVTPLYLAILTLFFPQVNKTVLIATSFIGVFMGLGNFVLEFVLYPAYWWIGVLHIPLFIISLYSLLFSFNEIAAQVRKTVVISA
jgi:hypothetical protein